MTNTQSLHSYSFTYHHSIQLIIDLSMQTIFFICFAMRIQSTFSTCLMSTQILKCILIWMPGSIIILCLRGNPIVQLIFLGFMQEWKKCEIIQDVKGASLTTIFNLPYKFCSITPVLCSASLGLLGFFLIIPFLPSLSSWALEPLS